MKKKSLVSLIIAGAMLFSACAVQTEQATPDSVSVTENDTQQETTQNTDKQSIVTTSFHEYDWVMQVLGDKKDNFDVTLLMDTGIDLHSYEPTVEDISIISSADLFIYNGGHSQGWVEDIIAQPVNSDLKAVNIMENLGDAVKEEIAVEGMQLESDGHDHDHDEAEDEHDDHDHDETEDEHDDHDHDETEDEHDDHDHDEAEDEHDDHDHDEVEDEHDDHDHDEVEDEHDDHDHDETEDEHDDAQSTNIHVHDDEHIWLSLNNSMAACEFIADAIEELDPANEDIYEENADKYIDTLDELDDAYEDAIENADRDTLIFADRFPFLYMMLDYDVNYYAAFQGCSAEAEASIETITFLAEKVNEYNIKKLLILDNGLTELAQTVINSSNVSDCETLVLHSMQSVSAEQIDAGATYYSIMSDNLEVLKLALSA